MCVYMLGGPFMVRASSVVPLAPGPCLTRNPLLCPRWSLLRLGLVPEASHLGSSWNSLVVCPSSGLVTKVRPAVLCLCVEGANWSTSRGPFLNPQQSLIHDMFNTIN